VRAKEKKQLKQFLLPLSHARVGSKGVRQNPFNSFFSFDGAATGRRRTAADACKARNAVRRRGDASSRTQPFPIPHRTGGVGGAAS
jgi:hypothetical protein